MDVIRSSIDGKNKYVEKNIAASWCRPAGPLNVWQTIDITRSSDDQHNVRLSIQDIPEDRYDEAVNFMCEYFLKEEATCKALNLAEDEDAVNDSKLMWDYLLRGGMSVGAFVLNSNGSVGELVGMNVLYVATEEIDNTLNDIVIKSKSAKLKNKFICMHDVCEKFDVREIYGVDKYLDAFGLAVKHDYRGQRLGVRLLEARNNIGRKYGITATSTLFMGPSSQVQAERSGFITIVSQEYAQVMDIDGRPMFPNIDAKVLKAMVKELR